MGSNYRKTAADAHKRSAHARLSSQRHSQDLSRMQSVAAHAAESVTDIKTQMRRKKQKSKLKKENTASN